MIALRPLCGPLVSRFESYPLLLVIRLANSWMEIFPKPLQYASCNSVTEHEQLVSVTQHSSMNWPSVSDSWR